MDSTGGISGPPRGNFVMAFHRRGDTAWKHYTRTGLSVPADDMLKRLQAKLDAKRAELADKGSREVSLSPNTQNTGF
jgi:hypothetical protein